ncbi:hypothetical protein GYH30_044879 [Glycine max]|nr:hypothetical protein GYH30_044879 [Glycine max]
MWSFSYSHTLFFFNLTHTHAATNKGQVLDSMKSSVLTVEAASDFFHKMVAMKSLPRVKGSNLLFGIIAKMKHYATAISLIKHVFQGNGYQSNSYIHRTITNGLCKDDMVSKASDLFWEMSGKGIQPNLITYNSLCHDLCSSLIRGWCKTKNLNKAMYLFGKMVNNGLNPDVVTWRTLIGHDQLPNLQTCAIILDGLFKCHFHAEAMSVFRESEKMNLDLNIVIYNIILDGLCSLGKLNEAQEIFSCLPSKGVKIKVVTYTIMIKGLCKEGILDDVEDLVMKMGENGCSPDGCSYNVFVQGLLRRYDISRMCEYKYAVGEIKKQYWKRSYNNVEPERIRVNKHIDGATFVYDVCIIDVFIFVYCSLSKQLKE